MIMAYKFKKKLFGFMDMLRFSATVPKRREIFAHTPAEALPRDYAVNATARLLHPGSMTVRVDKIIEHAPDLKTFVFVPDGKHTLRLAPFRAGQYITITAEIGSSRVTRAYTLASSPLDALEGNFYMVTVKAAGILSDYLCGAVKVGDELLIGEPSGDFCYEPLRDRKQVVAVAGGCGITSLLSMAKAAAEGTEDYNMTLFYCASHEYEFLFRDELDAMAADGKIKVVYVLEHGELPGCASGLLTADIVRENVTGEFTLFMCGSDSMYAYVRKELSGFGLRAKDVRVSPNGIGDRKDGADRVYALTVRMRDKTFTVPCRGSETVLTAMERAGIHAPAKCRAGGCGFCRSKLLSGEYTAAEGRDKRRLADFAFGWVHPCCIYPESDMTLEVPQG